uniref:CBM20 domain-containing protein n=1 Tax=Aegilops tauschii subsp. strangulata TaxID=200361 RepID=A0A452Y3B7_AEGTS
QLYVSLKMENARIIGDLVPHVYGSEPIIGSWEPARALAMERELASMWELSFVVPPDHETLDFKFLLKPKDAETPCIIEEGPTRLLTGGMLEGDVRLANFRLNGDDELLEFRVFNKADIVSPLDLAASWRVYKENFQPSKVRGIPDISINEAPTHATEDGSGSSLELDLEHYVVPTPTAPPTEYAANLAATPASLDQPETPWTNDMLLSDGIQSPRSAAADFKDDSYHNKAMPEAAGAVAAAAVADRLHGSKEDRKLAIVLVGLPARGKTFTAVKLTRYLRWLGHETKHFNVGKYRRLKHGANQSADFFRPDNQEGIEARNEVAALAMEDMIDWMHGGGQVGIFDATNSTRKRRYMLMKMAEGNCKIIFLETICNDRNIIERNVRLKIQQSPDYADQPDYEAGLQDFLERLTNYEKGLRASAGRLIYQND